MTTLGNGLYGAAWKIDGLTFSTYTNGMDALWEKILTGSHSYGFGISQANKAKLEEVDRKLGLTPQSLLSKEDQPLGLFQLKSADLEAMIPYNKLHIQQIAKKVKDALESPLGAARSSLFEANTAYFHNYVNIEGFGPTQVSNC